MIKNKRSHNIAYRCYNIWNVGDFSVESEESDVCWPSPTITICSPLTVQGKPLIRDPNVFHLKMVRPGLQSFRLPVRESKENARYNQNVLNISIFNSTSIYWIGSPLEAGVTRFSQYAPSVPLLQAQWAAVLQHIT